MTTQLQPIDLVSPGFFGINYQQSGSILSPQYAVDASNAIIDSAGRLAGRDGYSVLTSTPITSTPIVRSIHEYNTSIGTTETILSWDGGIANDIADPEGNDISGAVVDTDGNWWFQDFNDKVIGFQHGKTPIVYDGTGTFTSIVAASGTLPTSHSGVGLCAFGRVWALTDDGATIQYSGLLDETDWGDAGAGIIAMHNVWTDGTDEVTAIRAFNGSLIVFGKRHIVFWSDGQGSALGLDPDYISVVDTVEGTGCLTQWSVQPVGESDLLYLSRSGVQSLSRVVSERSNPVANLTKNVRDELRANVAQGDVDLIRSAYSPENGFYLLSQPDRGITWVLDQRRRYTDQDGDLLSIITIWDLAPYSWCVQDGGDVQLGGTWGVGLYTGSDDNGSTYRFRYESPWLDLGENVANFLKMLKRVGAILFVQSSTDIVFKWATDFKQDFTSAARTVSSDGASEYGIAEYGIAEYSGGLSLRIIKIPARDRGQYFKIAIEADVDGEFAIQQIELFTKIGRIA